MMRLALILGVIGFARFAVAGTIEEETKSALGDYAKGKFDEAVQRIETAILAHPDAKPASLAQAYKALAAAEAARRNMGAARAAIALALRLDPTVRFDPRRFPRSLVEMLRELRASVPPTASTQPRRRPRRAHPP